MSDKGHHKKHGSKQKIGKHVNPDDVRVRFATIKDVDALHKLSAKVCKHNYLLNSTGLHEDDFDDKAYFSHGMKKYFTELVDPPEQVKTVVVEIGGNIVGSISIMNSDDHFVLTGLAVDPALQGMGIGRHLMSVVNKIVGSSPVVTHEFVSAWGAINLYFANGFLIDIDEPLQVVKPDWMKDDIHLTQYKLVRTHGYIG